MDWSVNTYKPFKDMEPKSIMDVTVIPIEPVDIGLSSSEKANSGNSSKPRKKTMTSVYLKYFETASDGKSRRCKFCGQSYSIATATGNLGRHLSNRHAGYDKSGEAVTNSVSQPGVSTAVTVAAAKKPQHHQAQARTCVVDYDHLNWLLVRWLVVASLPPSTLEETWLANSYKFLNPSVQLWPTERYRAVFNEVFRSMQEDVRASLTSLSSRVSVALEFWTSYEQIHYMSVTCQWIDEAWCPRRVLLDICHVPYPCGGAEIFHCLVKTLRAFEIESRVLSCTHDNSQGAAHACHSLKEELESQKLGSFCYIPCAAHCLNLIIEDGLRNIKPIVSKVREFVLVLNSSADISDDFVRIASACQEGSWKFPLDASPRWSGNYQMLDIVRKAGKSMDAVMRKYEETLGSRMVLSSAEKNAVSIVQEYLEPFHKTTTNICSSKVPTVGLVLFFMDHISETIAVCRESRHRPDWLKAAAEEMAKKSRAYNNQVSNSFTYTAAILDPRIKAELIPDGLGSDGFLEEARAHFVRSYSSAHFPPLAGSAGGGGGGSSSSGAGLAGGAHEAGDGDGGGVSFAEEIARKKRRAGMGGAATDELTQYLSEPPAPIAAEALDWWKANGSRFPRLSAMARDFLAMRPVSVAPEELFCARGGEVEKQRLCMSHDSTRALLCVRSWILGGVKLKFKSTEIDYDRLMELATLESDNKKHK